MNHLNLLCVAGAISLMVGCASPQRKVKVLAVNDGAGAVVTYPADLRGAYVREQGSSWRACAEPAPDVALESLEKITANLKATMPNGVTADGSINTEFAAKVVELAGRTQIVLIARELLFRACEMSMNNAGDFANATSHFDKVADLVDKLGQAELNQSAARKSEATAQNNDAVARREEAKAEKAKALSEVLKSGGAAGLSTQEIQSLIE